MRLPVLEIPVVRVALVRETTLNAVPRTVGRPADAASVFRELVGDRDRETFAVLMLDVKHRVLAAHIASIGALDHSIVEPREVFRAAVLAGAKAVILGHNHPSGDPTPSDADCQITGRLRQAGQLLGIRVLDHVIIANGGAWVSLAERGGLSSASTRERCSVRHRRPALAGE